jgi:hypothetical protein
MKIKQANTMKHSYPFSQFQIQYHCEKNPKYGRKMGMSGRVKN